MRIAVCLEQTLGHRTHARNVIEASRRQSADVEIVRVEDGAPRRVPLPWTVRASVDACRQLRGRTPSDVTLFHTQSVGLLAPFATRGRPYVISLDATPSQMDAMGRYYAHRRHPRAIEACKTNAYKQVMHRAVGIVAWSDWARGSLIRDYGVDPRRIAVIPPGAGPEFFAIEPHVAEAVPRILFVGGDFQRKGGDVLLKVFERLHGRALLTIVTSTAIASPPNGVTVVTDATPGSRALIECYERADIFCLPTRADAAAIVVSEAMAAGLGVITTGVGAVGEAVEENESGLLVTPGSEPELYEALDRLIADRAALQEFRLRARARARSHLDARTRADELFGFLEAVV